LHRRTCPTTLFIWRRAPLLHYRCNGRNL
jgi:hypothetical protein